MSVQTDVAGADESTVRPLCNDTGFFVGDENDGHAVGVEGKSGMALSSIAGFAPTLVASPTSVS